MKFKHKHLTKGYALKCIEILIKLVGHSIKGITGHKNKLNVLFDVDNVAINKYKVIEGFSIGGYYWLAPRWKIPGIYNQVRANSYIYVRENKKSKFVDIEYESGKGREFKVHTSLKSHLHFLIKSGKIKPMRSQVPNKYLRRNK